MPSKQAGLFDFVDEAKVGVGYLDWIDEEFWVRANGDVACLKEVIDKKTVLHVRWPSNIKEGKTKTSVNIVPAILLKIGKWEDMCSSRDDIDKYDTLNPSKSDRKRICDRRSNDDVAESKTSQLKPQVEKITKKKKDASIRESQQLLMEHVKRETKNKKSLCDNLDSDDQVKRVKNNKVSNQKSTHSHKKTTDQPKSLDDPVKIVSDQLSNIMKLMNTFPTIVETAIANQMSHLDDKLKEFENKLSVIQNVVNTFHSKLSAIENKIESLQSQDTILWNEIDCIMSGTSVNCDAKMRPSAGGAMESTKACNDGSELPKLIDHTKPTISSLVSSSETKSRSSMRILEAQKVTKDSVPGKVCSIGTSGTIQSPPPAVIFAESDTQSSKTSTAKSCKFSKLDIKNQPTTGLSASVKELVTSKIGKDCVSAKVTLNNNGSSGQSSPPAANSYDIMELDLDVHNAEPMDCVHLHSDKSKFLVSVFDLKDVDKTVDKPLDDNDDDLTTRKLVKTPISITTDVTIKSSTNLTDEIETFISIGGQLIDKNRIDLCNDTKISKLVNELMAILFTAEEMGNSSLTGKVSNIHLKRGASEIRPKRQLDPIKMKGLYDYILDQKPKCTRKEITTAIQLKLKYEATKLHGGVGFKRAKPTEK